MSEQFTELHGLLRSAELKGGGAYAITRGLTGVRLRVAQGSLIYPVAIIGVLSGRGYLKQKKMIIDVKKGDMVVAALHDGKTLDFAAADAVCILIGDGHPLVSRIVDLDMRIISSASASREIASEYYGAVAQILLPAPTGDDLTFLDRLLGFVLKICSEDETGKQSTYVRVTRLIQGDLSNPDLSLRMVAERLGLSRTSIYRAMGDYGGVAKYILRMRLEEALLLLATTSYRHGIVNDVSKRLCFRSPAHFSRAFSQQFGRSPGEVHALANQLVRSESFVQYIARRDSAADGPLVLEWLNKSKA